MVKKRIFIGSIVAGMLLIGAIGNGQGSQPAKLNATQTNTTSSVSQDTVKESISKCDGVTVTASCILDGVSYETYIYHPAVTEKTHTETVTSYTQEVTGYCTLCSDGTYSPSCATGRGACSHHGGVAQWNAPVFRSVPVSSSKTVVDAPAQEAYYEKILK